MNFCKSVFFLCFFIIISLSIISDVSHAAGKKSSSKNDAPQQLTIQQPAGKVAGEGDIINTEYFKIKLPKGWFMPYPLNKKELGISCVFADEKSHVTVTMNIIKAKFTAKDLADRVLPDMRKSGLKTSGLKMVNGMYMVELKGKANGQAWFASDGNICSATVILSQSVDIKAANELLKAITSSKASLFPVNV